MKVLIQRVTHASVIINEITHAQIDKGMLLFVCLEKDDTNEIVDEMASRVCALRIFEDEKGKMNLNCSQMAGHEILSISQFTLSWPGKKGNRPSFTNSMEPARAQLFYELFNNALNKKIPTKRGIFGADMKVSLTNDGPVTFFLDSSKTVN